MALRKDLYVLIGFHFLVNMWMAFGIGWRRCKAADNQGVSRREQAE
jgi:hypothetical protein